MPDGVVQWFDPAIEDASVVRAGAAPEKRRAEIITAWGSVPLTVVARGHVDEDAIAYTCEKVARVADLVGDPILDARVKLTYAGDPARERRAMVQASLDVSGEILRAHVAGHTMREAADLLQSRLRDKIAHRAERHEALHSVDPTPHQHEWTHATLPAVRPEYFDRPAEQRELVRHKAFTLSELTPDEAAFDMEQLDYQFHLFQDLASGEDSLIERTGDNRFRLTRLHAVEVDGGPTAMRLDVSATPAPEMLVGDAIDRLNTSGEPFVFFANAQTGRGNVVYRRYDGHYGLITPADAAEA